MDVVGSWWAAVAHRPMDAAVRGEPVALRRWTSTRRLCAVNAVVALDVCVPAEQR